jgi:hypothetical protein
VLKRNGMKRLSVLNLLNLFFQFIFRRGNLNLRIANPEGMS